MAAYVILDARIIDPELYERYREMGGPTVLSHGGRFQARGGKTQVLEGAWDPHRIVILEFESIERARQWYDSTEYREARRVRQAASEGSLLLVEGV